MKLATAAAALAIAVGLASPANAFFGGSGGSVAHFRNASRVGPATVLVYPGRYGCFTVLHTTRHAPAGVYVPPIATPLTLTVAPGGYCSPHGAIHAATVFPNPAQFDVKLFYVDQSGGYVGSEQISIQSR